MEELRKIDVGEPEIVSGLYTHEVLKKIGRIKDIRRRLKVYSALGEDIDHKEHYGNLSARINSKEFICTATQTSGLPEIELRLKHFPLVTDFRDGLIYWRGEKETQKPSVESSTHDGFYRGNSRIMYVAHGHLQSLYDHYQDRPHEALVWDLEITYGSPEIRRKALEDGLNPLMLGHDSPYGSWGLVIPRGHFNAFFIVGESPKAIQYGFLRAYDSTTFSTHNTITEEFTDLENSPVYAEDI